jgi:hypothetical protein
VRSGGDCRILVAGRGQVYVNGEIVEKASNQGQARALDDLRTAPECPCEAYL